MKQRWNELIEFIVKEKYKIITAFIGAILSTIAIILYSNFKYLTWLNVILMIVCLIFAFFQIYYLYFKRKEWDKLAKVILSLLFFLLFILIIWVGISIFCLQVLDLPFTNDYLMYSIFLTPAFVFVLIIIMLILYSLQYA